MKKVQWVSVSIASLTGILTACGSTQDLPKTTTVGQAVHSSVQASHDPAALTKAFLESRKHATAPLGSTTASVRCASAF